DRRVRLRAGRRYDAHRRGRPLDRREHARSERTREPRGDAGRGGRAQATAGSDQLAVGDDDQSRARLDQACEGGRGLDEEGGEGGEEGRARRREEGEAGRCRLGESRQALITRERRTRRPAEPRAAARSGERTWRQARARVVTQREYGAGFRWLELELPSGFVAPVAGQFVQLLIEFPSPVLLPRPMSAAAAPRVRGRLRVGFLCAAVGAGTRALAELPPGAHVSVTGPLGRGYPLHEQGTPVLVAGGRGVAPLLMAAEALAKQRRGCEFVFGARTAELLV